MRPARLSALSAFLLALSVACTSTDTSVTAPAADKCQVRASNAPSSFSSAGGTGTVTITAPRDCSWSAAPTASWVTFRGPSSGQGDTALPYAVAENPIPAARSASITVGSQSVALSQAAAPCRFSINRLSDAIGASGGRLSVSVSTSSGCGWTSSTNVNWISMLSGQNGNGSGTVELSVAANGGAARVGAVNVAGQTYTVSQDAAPVAPGPPPPPTNQHVTFTGVVLSASGRCPELTLNVSGRITVTDKSTRFRGMSCDDATKGGRSISVDGTQDPTGLVHADTISKGDENGQ